MASRFGGRPAPLEKTRCRPRFDARGCRRPRSRSAGCGPAPRSSPRTASHPQPATMRNGVRCCYCSTSSVAQREGVSQDVNESRTSGNGTSQRGLPQYRYSTPVRQLVELVRPVYGSAARRSPFTWKRRRPSSRSSRMMYPSRWWWCLVVVTVIMIFVMRVRRSSRRSGRTAGTTLFGCDERVFVATVAIYGALGVASTSSFSMERSEKGRVHERVSGRCRFRSWSKVRHAADRTLSPGSAGVPRRDGLGGGRRATVYAKDRKKSAGSLHRHQLTAARPMQRVPNMCCRCVPSARIGFIDNMLSKAADFMKPSGRQVRACPA